jgi:hypothetical protein|tara:strand:- start:1295 stop:1945 length:651 start_codon:yes stop_codon:yes gene_type:complete
MSLKLINGLFYYEHDLELDNEALIKEITTTRENPGSDLDDSRPSHKDVDMQHTFYEDVPLKQQTFSLISKQVGKVLDDIFNLKTAMNIQEIWGHFTPPGEQTMIHNHFEKNTRGLSWVYYPHMPENAGNLIFQCQVDTQRIMWEINSTAGKIYFFSRDILHFVTRNASNENRISISGNVTTGSELNLILNNDHQFTNNYWYFVGRDGERIVPKDEK